MVDAGPFFLLEKVLDEEEFHLEGDFPVGGGRSNRKQTLVVFQKLDRMKGIFANHYVQLLAITKK